MRVDIGIVIFLLIVGSVIGFVSRENKKIEDEKFNLTCETLTGKVNNFDGYKECVIHFDELGYYKTYSTLRKLKRIEFIINNFNHENR